MENKFYEKTAKNIDNKLLQNKLKQANLKKNKIKSHLLKESSYELGEELNNYTMELSNLKKEKNNLNNEKVTKDYLIAMISDFVKNLVIEPNSQDMFQVESNSQGIFQLDQKTIESARKSKDISTIALDLNVKLHEKMSNLTPLLVILSVSDMKNLQWWFNKFLNKFDLEGQIKIAKSGLSKRFVNLQGLINTIEKVGVIIDYKDNGNRYENLQETLTVEHGLYVQDMEKLQDFIAVKSSLIFLSNICNLAVKLRQDTLNHIIQPLVMMQGITNARNVNCDMLALQGKINSIEKDIDDINIYELHTTKQRFINLYKEGEKLK